jgi:DNA-binding transcriptional ArsR family regulator
MASEPVPAFERRPATDAEAKALASGLRVRILRLTLDRALTNKEIADALGRNPASILHHVRTLVDTGFLRAERPRRGVRGSREIPYRSTGKSWYVSTPFGWSSILDAFLAELESVPDAERDLARLGLRLPPEEMEEFQRRLQDLLQEFHDRPRDPTARPYSVFVAVHPDTSTPGERLTD